MFCNCGNYETFRLKCFRHIWCLLSVWCWKCEKIKQERRGNKYVANKKPAENFRVLISVDLKCYLPVALSCTHIQNHLSDCNLILFKYERAIWRWTLKELSCYFTRCEFFPSLLHSNEYYFKYSVVEIFELIGCRCSVCVFSIIRAMHTRRSFHKLICIWTPCRWRNIVLLYTFIAFIARALRGKLNKCSDTAANGNSQPLPPSISAIY